MYEKVCWGSDLKKLRQSVYSTVYLPNSRLSDIGSDQVTHFWQKVPCQPFLVLRAACWKEHRSEWILNTFVIRKATRNSWSRLCQPHREVREARQCWTELSYWHASRFQRSHCDRRAKSVLLSKDSISCLVGNLNTERNVLSHSEVLLQFLLRGQGEISHRLGAAPNQLILTNWLQSTERKHFFTLNERWVHLIPKVDYWCLGNIQFNSVIRE